VAVAAAPEPATPSPDGAPQSIAGEEEEEDEDDDDDVDDDDEGGARTPPRAPSGPARCCLGSLYADDGATAESTANDDDYDDDDGAAHELDRLIICRRCFLSHNPPEPDQPATSDAFGAAGFVRAPPLERGIVESFLVFGGCNRYVRPVQKSRHPRSTPSVGGGGGGCHNDTTIGDCDGRPSCILRGRRHILLGLSFRLTY
jgi:hypothetical protein